MFDPVTVDTKLIAALMELQTKLPDVRKTETAKVKTKTGGEYEYSYADLHKISEAIRPKLAECGLLFIALPVLPAWDEPTLYGTLYHTSGASISGSFKLPNSPDPQVLGSAITYGRRYLLCTMTGLVADKDDDGAEQKKAAAREVDRNWVQQARESADYEETRTIWKTARAGGAGAGALAEIAKLGEQLKDRQERKDEKTEAKTDGEGQADGKSDPA